MAKVEINKDKVRVCPQFVGYCLCIFVCSGVLVNSTQMTSAMTRTQYTITLSAQHSILTRNFVAVLCCCFRGHLVGFSLGKATLLSVSVVLKNQ
jgi:hypothetical protein